MGQTKLTATLLVSDKFGVHETVTYGRAKCLNVCQRYTIAMKKMAVDPKKEEEDKVNSGKNTWHFSSKCEKTLILPLLICKL